MLPIISQVCTLNASFEEDLRDYAAAHCDGVEVWLTKLEDFVARRGVPAARDLIAQSGLVAPVASYQGGLLASQGDRRREAWKLFDRRLQLCHDVGIGVLVLACDVTEAVSAELLGRIAVSLADAAQRAEACHLRLALEFQGRSTVGNNLQTAIALVQEVGSEALGVCLDLFHFWIGPSKFEDLGLLTGEWLVHVQLCDLADVPREWATDGDRILPGEGDLPVVPVIERLKELGYDGAVSLETMNTQLWQVPTLQFAEIATTALRGIVGPRE